MYQQQQQEEGYYNNNQPQDPRQQFPKGGKSPLVLNDLKKSAEKMQQRKGKSGPRFQNNNNNYSYQSDNEEEEVEVDREEYEEFKRFQKEGVQHQNEMKKLEAEIETLQKELALQTRIAREEAEEKRKQREELLRQRELAKKDREEARKAKEEARRQLEIAKENGTYVPPKQTAGLAQARIFFYGLETYTASQRKALASAGPKASTRPLREVIVRRSEECKKSIITDLVLMGYEEEDLLKPAPNVGSTRKKGKKTITNNTSSSENEKKRKNVGGGGDYFKAVSKFTKKMKKVDQQHQQEVSKEFAKKTQ
jgi:hypothetical protein